MGMATIWNRPAVAAAVLMGLTSALHLFGGEFDVHRPLLAQTDTAEMALYASVLWHGISAMLVLNTVALLYGARIGPGSGAPAAMALAGAQTLALAAVFLFYGMVRLGNVFAAPQWTILLAAGGLACLAALPRQAPRLRTG
jgi:hypothetical protein